MTANDPTGVVAGEPFGFTPGEVEEGQPHALPQRIPGSTLGVDSVAEAEVQRAARRIESEGTR